MKKDEKPYRLLVIEDNSGDFFLIEEYLEDHVLNPLVVRAISFADARQKLNNTPNNFDIILLDLSLPDKSGEELILEVLHDAKNTPVIILTGYTDIQFSIKSLSLGISDYLLKDELSAITLYKSIVYNIERKKVLSRLQESEKRYSDLFQLSPQPMWVYDLESFQFLDVNEAAIKHYGYSKDEFLSMSIKDIRPAGEIPNLITAIGKSIEKDALSYKGVFKHKKKDNQVISVEVRSNIIYYKGKKSEVILANDITDRLKYIDAIEQQNEKLKEIAWIQSHVVRAPLARLMGILQMREKLVASGMSYEEQFNTILKSAEELDEIIKEISEMAQQIKILSNK